jgi:hypothetical protein
MATLEQTMRTFAVGGDSVVAVAVVAGHGDDPGAFVVTPR